MPAARHDLPRGTMHAPLLSALPSAARYSRIERLRGLMKLVRHGRLDLALQGRRGRLDRSKEAHALSEDGRDAFIMEVPGP